MVEVLERRQGGEKVKFRRIQHRWANISMHSGGVQRTDSARTRIGGLVYACVGREEDVKLHERGPWPDSMAILGN